MFLVEIALFLGAVMFVGFKWPQTFDPVTWVGMTNPFRNTEWVTRMNPPWLLPAIYVLAMIVLEFRTGLFPAVIGAGIVLATFAPDFFDFLGEWNFAVWKHMRTVGVLTMAFGFGIFVWMKPLVDLALIMLIAYYLWRQDPEFFRTIFGWFKVSKEKVKSA
ncbi:hypothetical protein FJY93_00625 [Candidatus Kaiserbacteria bacterium]|nr:hypothetical protein [Candidatus Kaiserbacteria bacterium]